MKRLVGVGGFLAVLGAALAAGTTLVRAAAVHTEFTGGVGLFNPCNGEIVSGTGPNKIVYIANADGTHFTMHLTLQIRDAVGNQGNRYVMSFIANGTFDAPSGSFGNVTFFDVPVHSEIIAKGGAPDFDLDLFIRVFVVSGTATGSLLIGPATTACHG